MVLELAAARGNCLYCVFVNLQKAYDSVPCAKLFEVLWHKLGVAPSTIKCLHHMYTDIRASILIGQAFSRPFKMHEGVRQGCPASPLVFSLYADCIEKFLQSELVAHLSTWVRATIRIAGLSLPVLLFADDMVLLGMDCAVVQR